MLSNCLQPDILSLLNLVVRFSVTAATLPIDGFQCLYRYHVYQKLQ